MHLLSLLPTEKMIWQTKLSSFPTMWQRTNEIVRPLSEEHFMNGCVLLVLDQTKVYMLAPQKPVLSVQQCGKEQ